MRAPYLPEAWDNDAEMKGLMALPKAKRVNPTNYDRVIDFWKGVIYNYCKHEHTCLISIDELKHKFRRGTQIPSPLPLVLQEMQQGSLVQSESEYNKRNQGWLNWGMSFLQPTSWIGLNGAVDEKKTSERFVNLPVLEEMANELLRFYKAEYETIDCPEVVDYKELRHHATHIIRPECFELVVTQLNEMGEVSVGKSKSGDKVLKFKDQSSKGPVRFTENDASVHDLRKTMSRLEVELKKLEEQMTKFLSDAQVLYKKGDKKAALQLMKKKKLVESVITAKDRQYQNLLSMMQQLAQSKQTKEILDIYKASSSAFKQMLHRQGLTPENVDNTLDDVHEALRDYNEIEEALRDGMRNTPVSRDSIGEDDLEKELDDLLADDVASDKTAGFVPGMLPDESEMEMNKVRIGKRVLDLADLPEVPSTSVAASPSRANGDSLEARWKRLRAE